MESIPPKVKLAWPAWVWVVITLLILLAVTTAIVLPILLIVPTAGKPLPPSPVHPIVTPPPGVTYAVVTELPAPALLNQLKLPESGGLTKASGAMAPVGPNELVLTMGGSLSDTVFFRYNTTTQQILGPYALDYSTSASFQGTLDNGVLLYNPRLVTTAPWRQCYASALTVCVGEPWITNPHLNPELFVAPFWKTLPSRRCIISLYSDRDQCVVSVQSNSKLLTELDVKLKLLSSSLNDAIIAKFYSSNQINLTFGVAERFTNSVFYMTWTDLVTAPPVSQIAIPYTSGRLLGCDMTYDGQFLIVLSEGELRLYTRDLIDVAFTWSDTLYFNPKKTPLNNCAIDRFVVVPSAWQAALVTVKPNLVLFLKIDTGAKKFMADRIRQCSTSQISSTTGQLCLVGTQPTSHVTMGVVSDESGQQEAILIGSDY